MIFENESQWAEWRNQPGTKAFFESLSAIREKKRIEMETGSCLRENPEATGMQYALDVARLEFIQGIEQMSFEDYQLFTIKGLFEPENQQENDDVRKIASVAEGGGSEVPRWRGRRARKAEK
jgi:hypothetical protein